jgi:mRNA degradation ribonuclease J1/J2
VYKDRIEVRELVDVQPWYTDGAVVGDAESLELKARQRLAWNGTVAVTLLLKRQGDNVTGKALVQPYGIYQGQGQLTTELATALDRWIGSLDARTPAATLEEQLRAAVRKFVRRYTTRKPVVLPFIHWLEGAPTQSTAAGRV